MQNFLENYISSLNFYDVSDSYIKVMKLLFTKNSYSA